MTLSRAVGAVMTRYDDEFSAGEFVQVPKTDDAHAEVKLQETDASYLDLQILSISDGCQHCVYSIGDQIGAPMDYFFYDKKELTLHVPKEYGGTALMVYYRRGTHLVEQGLIDPRAVANQKLDDELDKML